MNYFLKSFSCQSANKYAKYTEKNIIPSICISIYSMGLCALSSFSFNNRGFKNFLYSPTTHKPLVKSISMNTSYFRPISKIFYNALISYHSIVASISSLVTPSSPLTVFRGIRAIVINSIESLPLIWDTHVFKKIFKTFLPAGAYINSPIAIIFISRAFIIMASLFYRVPNVICGSFAKAMRNIGLVQSFSSRASAFAMKTATRLRFVAHKMIAPYSSFISTIAKTIKIFIVLCVSGNNIKPIKFLPSQISHIFYSLCLIRNYTQEKELSSGL